MNMVRNTLILLLVSAALACSGNNQAINSANTANKTNANTNKAEANVYKNYPGEAAPKTAVAEENKPKIDDPVPVKTEGAKIPKINPRSVLRASSDGGSAFKFRSNKTFTVAAARTRATRAGKPIVKPTPTPAGPPEESDQ